MTGNAAQRLDYSRPGAWGAGGAMMMLVGLVVAAALRPQEGGSQPAFLSDHPPRASITSCAECHAEITDAFLLAPHARTLHSASDPEIRAAFDGRTFRRADTGAEYRYSRQGGRLLLSTTAYARDLPIDWVFGSGTHARTPLLTWIDAEGNTAGIEHSVSWYADGELGVTFGQDPVQESSGVHAIGHPRTPAEVINCFGCHSTFVPVQGQRIDLSGIEPGVGCARCHWNSADHVREINGGIETTIERFSQLTPADAVDRCGECHRRADEMEGPITSDNRTIIRFAPVGLVQSACFRQQDEVELDDGTLARLDCTTCHDPHRPTDRDWHGHTAVCLTCHDAGRERARDCSVAAREDNCLECHMPKVPMNEHLAFTDHWIRIRREPPAGDTSR